jgi:hypothetical protein
MVAESNLFGANIEKRTLNTFLVFYLSPLIDFVTVNLGVRLTSLVSPTNLRNAGL